MKALVTTGDILKRGIPSKGALVRQLQARLDRMQQSDQCRALDSVLVAPKIRKVKGGRAEETRDKWV